MRRLYYALRERLTAWVNLGDNWEATTAAYDGLLALERQKPNAARLGVMYLGGVDAPNHLTLRLADGRRLTLFARFETPTSPAP